MHNTGLFSVYTSGVFIWFSMGRTTLIPSKAKMAVPKKMGKDAGLAGREEKHRLIRVDIEFDKLCLTNRASYA